MASPVGVEPTRRTFVASAPNPSGRRELAPRLGIEPSVPALEVLAAHQRPREIGGSGMEFNLQGSFRYSSAFKAGAIDNWLALPMLNKTNIQYPVGDKCSLSRTEYKLAGSLGVNPSTTRFGVSSARRRPTRCVTQLSTRLQPKAGRDKPADRPWLGIGWSGLPESNRSLWFGRPRPGH